MTSEAESKIVSRRRILPFFGLAAAAGLALRYTAAEAQTSGMEQRQGDATGASNGVTSAAEARLHRNSQRKVSLCQTDPAGTEVAKPMQGD